MPVFTKNPVRKALDLEISRANRFGYYIGVLLLDVSEATPRGVHKHLPGITVGVRHFRSLLRDYDIVIKTKLRRYTVILPHLNEGESANLVRDRIQFISQTQEWEPVNIGVAIFPEHGATSRELLKAAERDLLASVKPGSDEESAQQST